MRVSGLAVSSSMAQFHTTRVLDEPEAPLFENDYCVINADKAPCLASRFSHLYLCGTPTIDVAVAVTPLDDIIIFKA